MHNILLISNNQILKDNLGLDHSYNVVSDLSLKDIDQQIIGNIDIIIFESDDKKEKENFKLLLGDIDDKPFFLIEISRLQFRDSKKYQKYLFLEKPIRLKFLLNKIDQIIKNYYQSLILLKNCQIDVNKRIIIPINKKVANIKLTELEAAVIAYLYDQQGIVQKDELLAQVWNYKNVTQMTQTGIAESTISKLKKKIIQAGLKNFIEKIGNNQYKILMN